MDADSGCLRLRADGVLDFEASEYGARWTSDGGLVGATHTLQYVATDDGDPPLASAAATTASFSATWTEQVE